MVPTWHEGETFSTSGRTFRILEIDTDLPDELADEGINAVWYVEAA